MKVNFAYNIGKELNRINQSAKVEFQVKKCTQVFVQKV